MSSGVTLSGFNNIDFTTILNAIMQQERQPVTLLETQQTVLAAQKSQFTTLAGKLSSLQSAADALTSVTSFSSTTASVSDSTRVSVSSGSTTPVGTYEIKTKNLARAQVTLLSQSSDGTTQTGFGSADAIVATGGTLSIGDKTVTLGENTTLQGLADAINGAGAGVSASVIHNATGFHLMMTGQETGLENAFSMSLSNGTLSGVQTVAQAAEDAEITLNGVSITNSSNTFSDAIAGASFTVYKEDENPVIVTITATNDSVKSLVQKLMSVFNDGVTYLSSQQSAANSGETDNIGRDPLVRSLRRDLTSALTATNTAGGGAYSSLAQIGFSISRTGMLELDQTVFAEALKNDSAGVKKLFYGTNGNDGVFGSFESAIKKFTDAGGLLPSAQKRLSDEATKVADRIAAMELRLETRRAALQKQFIEADLAISQLNSQSSSLSQLTDSL